MASSGERDPPPRLQAILAEVARVRKRGNTSVNTTVFRALRSIR